MDILEKLKKLRVNTGSFVCFGCGNEHNCSVHGCAILREAAAEIEKLRQESGGQITDA